MKILHIFFAGRFTEEMSYQENLIPKYHAKDGHEVIMLTTCYKWNDKFATVYTPPIDKIMNNGVRLVRKNYYKIINESISRKIRKVDGVFPFITLLSPNIIFFHGLQSVELLTVAKYANLNSEVRIVVDNHADYINSASNWISRFVLHRILWKTCAKKIEPYVKKFYGVTPLRCDFLRDMYDISEDKIELLVMGADIDRINLNQKDQIRKHIRNALSISEKDFVIISGGKIDKKKNIHLLMQAVKELAFDVKLIIFGIPNRHMKTIIEDLSKSERIRFLGWIESSRVYDYFLASDLAVFPGTHSVLWEQSVGTGIPGVFKHWKRMEHIDVGGNCKYLYYDEVSEIRSVLEMILSNKSEYMAMKKVAEEIGINKFSYREISRRAIEI